MCWRRSAYSRTLDPANEKEATRDHGQRATDRATSARNRGRLQIGTVGDIGPESPGDIIGIRNLCFDARLPLARDILAYQKHRVKRLRRLA